MPINPMIPPELTPEVVYLRGEYALSKYTIPYFSTVVPFSFAIDRFSLIEDIPEVARIEWSLAELFQRDLAWDRIHGELVRYLRNENRPQFFNALTLALLPRSGHGFGGKYESPHAYPRLHDLTLEDPLQIGGIQLHAYKETQGLAGKLRWDPKQIITVAVDGQHRLAAVKALKGRMTPEKLDTSYLPVIFLIPDPRTGFVEPPMPSGTVHTINTLRQIFIDLNKHARPVSDVRNLLLDDRDVECICVRTLIGERLSDTPETNRIPLPMVDWINDKKNKIEEGPFVTTVLLLRDIIQDALKQPDMEDFEEEDRQIRRWLQKSFKLGGDELADMMSQVQRCFHLELPLTFTPEQVDLLVARFKTFWRPYLYRIYSELRPYRRLWDYGHDHGLHTPQLVNLYAATHIFEGDEADKRAARIVNDIRIENPTWSQEKDFEAHLKHIDLNIKDESWAFKVVFQRALFRSFLALLDQAVGFVGDEPEETTPVKFTTQWVEAVNRLLESSLAPVPATLPGSQERFWAGIGLRPEGTIDFTLAGARRLAYWLSAWVCLYWLRPDLPASWDALSSDPRPLANIAFNSLNQRVASEGMLRLANAHGEYSEDGAKIAANEFRNKRYEAFIILLKDRVK